MAQEPAAPTHAAEIDELIKRIEDPEHRGQLLSDLRLLRNGVLPNQSTASTVPQTIPLIDRQLDKIASTALRLADWVGRLPNVGVWLNYQFTNEDRRLFWRQTASQILVALGPALAISWLVRIIAARRTHTATDSRRAHAGYLFKREGLSALAFVLVTFLALTWSANASAALVSRILVAILLFRLFSAANRLIFAPGLPAARLLPVTDGMAATAFSWIGLCLFALVLALVLPGAAPDLAMPPLIAGVLQHIAYVTLLFLASTALFRVLPGLTTEIVPTRLTKLRLWLGERGPWIGIATAVCVYAIWSLGFPGGAAFLLRAIIGSAAVIVLVILVEKMTAQGAARLTRPAGKEADDAEKSIQASLKNRYGRFAPRSVRALIYAAAFIALMELWNIGLLAWFWSDVGRSFTVILVRIAIVCSIALILAETVTYWTRRYTNAVDHDGRALNNNRNRTLATFFRNLALSALAVFCSVFTLGQMGVDATALLAGAGVIGLAVGFGSQKLVQDLINGLFILLGDTISVDDVVEIGGRAGVVEAMSMRTVTLRGYNGDVHTVPYSNIDSITNMTKSFSYADFDIGIGYGEHVDDVRRLLREIFEDMRRVREFQREMIGEIDIAGVDSLGESAVTIKGRIKTKPGSQWLIRREFTRRVKLTFDAHGVEFPFPQRTIHIAGQPDDQPVSPLAASTITL